MLKRVSLIFGIAFALLMASPVYAVFYGYWDSSKVPDSPIYTNHHRCHWGTTEAEIAGALARGHHLAPYLFWSVPTPNESFPKIGNSLKWQRYRWQKYNDAGLIDMIYMIESPYHWTNEGTGLLFTRSDLDDFVDIYKRNLPDYILGLSFDASDGDDPANTRVLLPGNGVPTDVDLAGLDDYHFWAPMPDKAAFDFDMNALLTAIRLVKDPGTDIFFGGQGFSDTSFLTPPTQSPHWYKDWVISESDVVGLVWFKWDSGVDLIGSNAIPLLVAEQEQVGADFGISTSPTPIPVPAPIYEGLLDRWTFNSDSHSDGTIGLRGSFPEGPMAQVVTPDGGTNQGYEFTGYKPSGGADRIQMYSSHRYGQFTMGPGGGPITIEAWFNLSSSATELYKTILSKKVDELYFGIKGNKVVGSLSGLESDDILDDTWYHAAYVIEGTEWFDEEKLYVNGVLVDSRPSDWNGITDENADIFIGYGNYDAITKPFHGIIDEVRIYDVALSGAAILNSYNTGPINAAPAIKVTESNGSTDVSEIDGLPDTYTVELLHGASDNVTVNLVFDNAQIDVSPVSLTWDIQGDPENWQNVKVVTVTANADAVQEGDHASIITQTAVSNDPIFNNPYNDDPNSVARNIAVNITEAPFCGDGNHVLIIGDISGPAGQPDCYLNLFDFAAITEDWYDCTDPANVICQ
jgi:hypothetical protein